MKWGGMSIVAWISVTAELTFGRPFEQLSSWNVKGETEKLQSDRPSEERVKLDVKQVASSMISMVKARKYRAVKVGWK